MMEHADELLPHFGIVATIEADEFKVVENSGLINLGVCPGVARLLAGNGGAM
jgi:hypothetical protein